jgi:hypothetical protein
MPSRAARYAALGVTSALAPGPPAAGAGADAKAAGRAGSCGACAAHLRGAEGDQLVQGVGDRAGGAGEYLADLVRGEGGAGELAQVGFDQLAQRAGPGRGPGRPDLSFSEGRARLEPSRTPEKPMPSRTEITGTQARSRQKRRPESACSVSPYRGRSSPQKI